MNRILNIYVRCKKQAEEVHANVWYTFFDYIYARLRFGMTGEDYFVNSIGVTLRNFQKKRFFTEFRSRRTILLLNNKEFCHYFENKLDFLEIFSTKGFIHHNFLNPKKCSFKEYRDFIYNNPKIIQKPVAEMQGHGVSIYVPSCNLEDDFEKLQRADVFLEAFVKQHPCMYLGNKSVNTIRVYTILDRELKPHILKAVLRAGVGESVVDNYCAGGVIYPVNVETGIVEACGESEKSRAILKHPGTDRFMLGFEIPNWQLLKDTLFEAALVVPEVRYVGWDIVITETGIDFIEGNHDPHNGLLEKIGLTKGFWPVIKDFY